MMTRASKGVVQIRAHSVAQGVVSRRVAVSPVGSLSDDLLLGHLTSQDDRELLVLFFEEFR